MTNTSPYPVSKRIAVVTASSDILAPMADPGIHAVIWKRNLQNIYSPLFTALADKNVKDLATLAGATNKNRAFTIFLEANTDRVWEIEGDSGIGLIEDFRRAAPPPIWDDMCEIAPIVATLRGARAVRMVSLNQKAGVPVYDDSVTRFWHAHSSPTAHICMNEAGLELLDLRSDDIVPTKEYDGESSYSDESIPANMPVIKMLAGDAVFFKDTIHRKSSQALALGRLALAIY